MPFLSPLSLLLLLPLGGAIILLYLLRLKRKEQIVSSVMLWQAALQDAQANAPLQKLKRNLLLLLQLLAVLLLVFAVARPFLWASGLGGKTTGLVLDGSASMKATDEPGSRFDEAKRRATEMVQRKDPGDAVAVVLSAEKPIILSPLSTDRAALLKAIRAAKPTDATGDMREAILLAASLIASRADARVTLLSDGAFGRLEPMTLDGAKLAMDPLGKRSENVAVTAFDVRDSLDGGGAREAFVTVRNFGKAKRTFPLEIRVGGKLADAHEVTLKPGESRSETFDSLPGMGAGGVVEARADVRDDLASDDTAYISLPPRRPVRILLVTEGNPFLERALNTDRRVELDAVRPAAYRPTDSASHEMTVFDDAAPPRDLPPGRYLFWGAKSLGNPLVPAVAAVSAEGESADRPQILDWSRTHPLMRFVDLANVHLLSARNIAPAPGAETLAETDAGPLIVAGEKGGSKAVYVGFSLLESDMPLRVAFPIFLTNTIRWLTVRPGDVGGAARPGEVIPLAAPENAGTVTVTRPDGGKDTLTVSPGSPAMYDKTGEVGVYRASGKGFSQTFAVSLLSPAESGIAPVARPHAPVADAPPESESGAAPAGKDSVTASASVRREIWPYLAALALILLTAEWVVYHRRMG